MSAKDVVKDNKYDIYNLFFPVKENISIPPNEDWRVWEAHDGMNFNQPLYNYIALNTSK